MKINYIIISLMILLTISCKKENKPAPIVNTKPVTQEKGTNLIFGIIDKMDTISYRDIVKENYDKKIFRSIDEERFENLRMLLLEDISIDFIIDSLEIECLLKPIFIKERNLTEVEIYADSDSKMNIRSEQAVRKPEFHESISILKKAYLEKYTVLKESRNGLTEYIELTDKRRRIKLSINEYSFMVSYKSEAYFMELKSLKKQEQKEMEKILELEQDSLKKEFLKMKNKSEFFKKEI